MDDFHLVPYDKEPRLPDPDYSFTLNVMMDNLADGANYAFFNDITYVRPKVPSLFTALSTGEFATNAAVYGVNTHSYVFNHLDVIEIVLNNQDPGKHPFHLHGHAFQVIYRSELDAGDYDPSNTTYPAVPMKRDTVLAPPNGNVVIRFRADNPGLWLFHCHLVSSLLFPLRDSNKDTGMAFALWVGDDIYRGAARDAKEHDDPGGSFGSVRSAGDPDEGKCGGEYKGLFGSDGGDEKSE